MSKAIIINEMKRLPTQLILALAGVIAGGLAVYIFLMFHPLGIKQNFYTLDLDRKGKLQFNCTPVVGTTMFPYINYKNDKNFKLEAKAVKSNTNLAVEIDGENLKFLTNTSVEAGSLEPAIFKVIENSDARLTTMSLGEGTTDKTIMAFIIDKKTGLGVWSKTSTTSLIPDLPNSQAYYYSCN